MIDRRGLMLLLCLGVTGCGGAGHALSPTAPTAPTAANIAGTWQGTFAVTGCQSTGWMTAVDFCASIPPTQAFNLQITQSGRSLSGTLTVRTLSGPCSGTVSEDGTIHITAQRLVIPESDVEPAEAFLTLTEKGETELTGTITANQQHIGETGVGSIDGKIIALTKS